MSAGVLRISSGLSQLPIPGIVLLAVGTLLLVIGITLPVNRVLVLVLTLVLLSSVGRIWVVLCSVGTILAISIPVCAVHLIVLAILGGRRYSGRIVLKPLSVLWVRGAASVLSSSLIVLSGRESILGILIRRAASVL